MNKDKKLPAQAFEQKPPAKTNSTSKYDTCIPNCIIYSVYKLNLIDEQVQDLLLYKISQGCYKDLGEQAGLEVAFTAAEFKKAFGYNGKSHYARMANAADHLTGMKIMCSDPKGKSFFIEVLYPCIKYEKGILTARIGETLRKACLEQKYFTQFNIRTLSAFERVSSLKLYKILRALSFRQRDGKNGDYTVSFLPEELKIKTGIVKLTEKASDVLISAPEAFRKAYNTLPEKDRSYDDWKHFQDRILRPNIKEINALTEISVKERKCGDMVSFTVTYKNNAEQQRPEEDRSETIPQIMELLEGCVQEKEAQAIAEAADYDLDMILEKYELMRSQKKMPKNITGWLIDAVRNDYKDGSSASAEIARADQEERPSETPEKKKTKKKEKKTDVNSPEKNVIAYELELTDAIFFDFAEDLSPAEEERAMRMIEKEGGIPKDAAMHPMTVKHIVQVLADWNRRREIIVSNSSEEDGSRSKIIVAEVYLLFLRCCVFLMTSLEPKRFGGRYMTYSQAIDRFNRRIRGDYERNFCNILKRCIEKYCSAAAEAEIKKDEPYMFSVILDTLENRELEFETFFNRTWHAADD